MLFPKNTEHLEVGKRHYHTELISKCSDKIDNVDDISGYAQIEDKSHAKFSHRVIYLTSHSQYPAATLQAPADETSNELPVHRLAPSQ